MKKIINAREVPESEKVFLKKSFDGWRVVHPFKKEDGTTDWFVVFTGGTWWNFFKTLLIVLLILAVTLSYAHDTQECRDLMENLCDYATNITDYCFSSPDPANPFINMKLPQNFTPNS